VTKLGQDQLLQAVAAVAPPEASSGCKTRALELSDSPAPRPFGAADANAAAPGCARTRALMLDDGGDEGLAPLSGGVPPSMQMRTQPGDDLIVTVFAFEHLTKAAYSGAGGANAKGHKTRGIVIQE
jgi:hypothetical protein